MKIHNEYLNMNFIVWRVECITNLESDYLEHPVICLPK